MPRAPQEIVDKLNKGEDQEGFEPLPEQLYLCTLVEVEEYEAKDANSFDGVILTWQVEQPREFAGEKIRFHRLSYSPRAAFKIREFWDALGYEYDSDFDEAVENQEKGI